MARCKTRKTFTSTRGHIGEYSSPATHVRVKALGATFVRLYACVSAAENTVVCTCSRRHRIYSSRQYPVLGRYASSCTDLSSLDPKYKIFLGKKSIVSRNISKIFLERKTRTRLYLLSILQADLSSLDPKYKIFLGKKSIVSRNILSQNIPRKKNQNAPIPSEHPPVRDCRLPTIL